LSYTLPELEARAAKSFDSRAPFRPCCELSPAHGRRHLVNYLRHSGDYDKRQRAAVTWVERRAIFIETHGAIAEQWPELASECRKQLKRKVRAGLRKEIGRRRWLQRCAESRIS